MDFSKYFEPYEIIKKYKIYIKEEDEKPAKITIEKNLKTGKYYANLKLPNGQKHSSNPKNSPEEALNDMAISNNLK